MTKFGRIVEIGPFNDALYFVSLNIYGDDAINSVFRRIDGMVLLNCQNPWISVIGTEVGVTQCRIFTCDVRHLGCNWIQNLDSVVLVGEDYAAVMKGFSGRAPIVVDGVCGSVVGREYIRMDMAIPELDNCPVTISTSLGIEDSASFALRTPISLVIIEASCEEGDEALFLQTLLVHRVSWNRPSPDPGRLVSASHHVSL
jgi:hypothetical protein